MDEKEFLRELGKIRTSRINEIIRAVNMQIPKAEAGLKNDVEEKFFDDTTREADELEKKHGVRPVFDMGEIEYDDPILDIYGDED